MIRTTFSELLGIDVPIVQAPIGAASTAQLVAAVSDAGGLGMLSGSWREPDELRALIADIQSRTERAFGVNLGLAWDQAERLAICLDAGVPVVSFFWGDPSTFVEEVHAAGAVVMQTIGSAEDARRQVANGVDVLVAQGWEAGGHVWGEVATMALIPAVVDAAGSVPVIAAGGIGDGRGMAAALALGAQGVWLGTRFLASIESAAHHVYKGAVIAADEAATAYTTLFDGGWAAPHRVLRNSTYRAWEAAGRPAQGRRPGEDEQLATNADGSAVRRYDDAKPVEGISGDVEALSLYAGQSAGLVHDVRPSAQIVFDLADEAERALRRALSTFGE
ncbi:nitronate monooxygenase [Agromyces ramosus]|uniref:Nitronate monooxygenase n=1 Tax=Agromyces ramosus TaxID=33879 RepID=A0A4Q7MHY1_9MICO|nr:nitronate monooxygenase [Agromyces ramosus]RZS66332.1 nitronate monooxygenase [Agromyces ramosus]